MRPVTQLVQYQGAGTPNAWVRVHSRAAPRIHGRIWRRVGSDAAAVLGVPDADDPQVGVPGPGNNVIMEVRERG
jgi:hypothetical protein